MSWWKRLLGGAHRVASEHDSKRRETAAKIERDKLNIEIRVKRIEATAKAYGIDLPNGNDIRKEST